MLKINKLASRLRAQPDKWLVCALISLAGFACQSDNGRAQAIAAAPAEQAVSPSSASVEPSYLLGKFDPARHPDFVLVGAPYTDKPSMYLRKECFESFKTMFEAAQKEGVTLKIISSTRTFDQQKSIWEGKWERFKNDAPASKDRALKILEYSSMPGSSRHHWGTDMDLNDLNNPSFEAGGKYEKVYLWLSAHAHEYGFCQPYTAGRDRGYREEKWHWSYTPLSRTFLQEYRNQITEQQINGFKGSETAVEIGIVQNYVLGINQACQ